MNKKPPHKSRMGGAPRITNRERVLLALVDAPDFHDQYELPRRFSQVGLSQRLGMAQSHVSRALNVLIEEGLLTHKRKRVIGEHLQFTGSVGCMGLWDLVPYNPTPSFRGRW